MFLINKENFTWFVYIPIAATLLYFFIINFSADSFFSLGYIYLLFLAIVVSLYPIKREKEVFSLGMGVSLATFVIYGLHSELLVSSIAVFAVMIKSNIKKDQHHRYALNLLMIAIVSIVSAGAYYWTENILAGLNAESYEVVVPVIVYLFINTISNHLVIYLIQRFYLRQENVSYFNQQLSFSLKINALIFPISLILILLSFEMGARGILLGSLPFLMVTLGYSFWGRDQSHIYYLTLVTKASQKMAKKMNMKKVKESFITSLLDVFPGEKVYYYSVLGDEQIVLERMYTQDQSITELNVKMNLSDNSILKESLATQSVSVYSKAQEWTPDFEYTKENAESLIILPVHISTKNKGIILMTHQKRSAFDEYIVSLVEVLHQYFITVLESVNHYEKLEKSHKTDHLTGLLNLRGLSEALNTMIQSKDYELISIIILDLDHFKRVNDIHGHEAGNEVLSQLGQLLKKFEQKNRFMTRYGGEEFVVLLKNYGRAEAYKLAEAIRKEIVEYSFEIDHSIATRKSEELSVTASLGVATYPDDCEDVYDLTLLADKAMSIGSKGNGRNRVTAYGGGEALNEKTNEKVNR